MKEKLIDRRQAAEYLGLPLKTLDWLIARKDVPHFRYGRRIIKFSVEQLDAWNKERNIVPDVKAS